MCPEIVPAVCADKLAAVDIAMTKAKMQYANSALHRPGFSMILMASRNGVSSQFQVAPLAWLLFKMSISFVLLLSRPLNRLQLRLHTYAGLLEVTAASRWLLN
jgi:hypothetical protein